MPIKRYKPTTPGRRGASRVKPDTSGVQIVEKSLLAPLKSKAGRNSSGRITVRHQGGGHKRAYRIVDFSSQIVDMPATVLGIQYDPNRTANVALLAYQNGQKVYALAVDGLTAGDKVIASRTAALPIKSGNRMALKHIPAGMLVSNIEMFPGNKSKIVRSAGAGATVLSQDDNYVLLKLPSGELRKFFVDCLATIGQVSVPSHSLVRLGKAGRKRHLGIRPRVRGKAMNPVDHPHGGGEGSNSIGLKHPKTPWGKPALGVKTRNVHRASDTLIVKRRKKK